MESLTKGGSGFIYSPESSNPFSGILEIHNICIYEKQDVYAKFSLTYDPDHTVSTTTINGGGRNPDFNDDLTIAITNPNAVLKCEIWMLSRAKHLMDDQLLGFALVPISSLSANATLTQDFHLSSTDLFHSPAGTIKLSLLLNTNTNTPLTNPTTCAKTSHGDQGIIVASEDYYCRVEFPDITAADQDQRMVSEYFARNGAPMRPDGSFLQLGAGPEDYEMGGNSSEGSSGRNTGDSRSGEKEEEAAMQQQIVEMYVRSMQQFTESLAKMKLPMELEKGEGDVIVDDNGKKMKKKDSGCSRVFYGSRAFF